MSSTVDFNLSERIRQTPNLADTPVPLVTTKSAPERLQALRRAGASAIIDKSFHADEVRAVLVPLFPPA
jgi:CheY-like chemotaxis protein